MWASAIDLGPITTDLTTVGGAVILLTLLIVGFMYVKHMVKSK